MAATDDGVIEFDQNVEVGSNSHLVVKGGRIQVGSGVFIGHGATIVAKKLVRIGSQCKLAEYVTIRDQDHNVRFDGLLSEAGSVVDPIVIGRDVWIGAKSTVLKGAKIGSHAVIGANAVVIGEIPVGGIAVGVPAKVVRYRVITGE